MSRLAAIDVGTNTVRLLVTEPDGREVVRLVEVTRLGQDVDATRVLAAAAVERTVAVVGSYVRRARGLGASRSVVAATSALRDAANRDEFCEAVRSVAGVEVEVLTGADEGRLTFEGATSGLPAEPALVVDIGGGSTELVRGTGRAESVWSLDLGAVRLRERCLKSDPPSVLEVEAAHALVRQGLREADRELNVTGAEVLVGVAGTVTTLAALSLGLKTYDRSRVHHSRLSAEKVGNWTEALLRMPSHQIRSLGAMHPGRADVIGSGALILREVVRWSGAQEVVVSESDILDGLISRMRSQPG
ncbi:MAG TPA: Ppx/GppA phosphatase family protein [Actinomycetota bacterium]|nr:Ppx/GppA phosphatase family protein [Actinomycetota bacterium]